MGINLIGSRDNTTLEDRLFNAATLISTIFSFIALIVNLISDFPLVLDIAILIAGFFCTIFYYTARYKKKPGLVKIPFLIICLLIVSFSWFFNDGLNGSISFYFFFAAIIFLFIFNKVRYWIVLLSVIFLAAVLIAIQLIYPHTVLPYPDNDTRILDIISTLILVLGVSGYTLIMFKQNLDNEREVIEKQKIVIEERNVELSYLNNQLVEQKEEILIQRDEIEYQRDELLSKNYIIEEKNKNITDSISYASRIQLAILPKQSYFQSCFKQSFVFYKPRDIVGGDFYFVKKIENLVVVAAADCTGHGVPGALMCMLGVGLLNEIITRSNELIAAEILEELRSHVKNSLHQTGKTGEQQDGMDIALCIVNQVDNHLQYSGANNPLWLYRGKEFIEIKADRQPVGVFPLEKPFTNHKIELFGNDIIYLFTDGYESQFGGGKGEKLKMRHFQEIVFKHIDEEMAEQLQSFEKEFNNWRGDLEQVDDVLLIGIKF